MAASNKKNLYVADEDLQWFEKAKELFPDVSVSKLIAESLKEKCLQKEAELKGMVEHKVYRGETDYNNDVFIGQEFRFDGLLIAEGKDINDTTIKVFVTKKGKFLVYRMNVVEMIEVMGFKISETYTELSKEIPASFLKVCADYLNMNSTTRTYEKLDI